MARFAGAAALLVLGTAAFASAQAFREDVRVRLVSIRLDVRDRDGRSLTDLKAPEVKLRIDGNNVAIEGLDRVAASPFSIRPTGGASAPQAGDVPASAESSSAASGSGSDLYLAILFDETSTNAYDRRDIFRQLESFLKDRTAAGVHVMLERFDGQLHTESPWTTDALTAVAALKKMQKHLSDARIPSPGDLRDAIHNGRKARDIEMQIDLSGRRSFDGILQALVRFSEVTGRKGLVLITDGTPLMTPFDLSLMMADSDSSTQGDRSIRADYLKNHGDTEAAKQIESALQEAALSTFTEVGAGQSTWAQRMAKITNKAIELDISFYPIDAEAVDRGTNPGVGSKWPGRAMPGVAGVSTATSSGMTARVSVGQSMTALASMTGGQAILNPLQASDRLGAIAAERESGYLLTFRDPSPNDGRHHKVEIDVQRPGAKVVYRRGYRVRSEDERTLDAVVAHLQDSSVENPLALRATFDLLRKEGGRDIVQMRLEYAPVEAPGDRTAERAIQMWAVCADDDGNRAKPIVRMSRAKRVADAKAPTFADSLQMGLPPGPYTWSVAVRDVPTGVTSYIVVRKQL